ncbi:hypothetical protein BJ322DRAFT_811415 [Thelephora terrestris]|uniref:Uncharacterized protein n=1 Tax=Thelephora terrestris TaxID=56493 RepID=A0A9P6HEL6_9AGAM|nr:hypothetical protein BJ322DRAFT_811415 [Thelephora terrestris]
MRDRERKRKEKARDGLCALQMNLNTISVVPFLPLSAWALACIWTDIDLHQAERKRTREPRASAAQKSSGVPEPRLNFLTVTYAYRRSMSAPRRSYLFERDLHRPSETPPALDVEPNPHIAMKSSSRRGARSNFSPKRGFSPVSDGKRRQWHAPINRSIYIGAPENIPICHNVASDNDHAFSVSKALFAETAQQELVLVFVRSSRSDSDPPSQILDPGIRLEKFPVLQHSSFDQPDRAASLSVSAHRIG